MQQQLRPASAATKYFNIAKFVGNDGYGVAALFRKATHTRLVASFTHLAPTNQGGLRSRVTVQATWSSRTVPAAVTVNNGSNLG